MTQTNKTTLVIVVICIVLFAALSGGGSGHASNKLTKAEWRAKLAGHYIPGTDSVIRMSILPSVSSGDFKNFMGSPNSTQTVGDESYWYYDCSDGTFSFQCPRRPSPRESCRETSTITEPTWMRPF